MTNHCTACRQLDEANRAAAHWEAQYEAVLMENRALKVALAEANQRDNADTKGPQALKTGRVHLQF